MEYVVGKIKRLNAIQLPLKTDQPLFYCRRELPWLCDVVSYPVDCQCNPHA